MQISEINPFVRYAAEITSLPQSDFTCSYDCRLLYLSDGNFTFFIDDEILRISKGTLLIWPSGHRYRFENSKDIKGVLINFDYTQKNLNKKDFLKVEFESDFKKDSVLESISFENAPALNSPVRLENMSYICTELYDIIKKAEKQKMFFYEYSSAILKKVITEAAEKTLAENTAANEIVEKVIEYIGNNYAINISNRDISDYVHYHEYYIGKLMEKCTGMTIHKYLLQYRLKMASKLVIGTMLPIAEIAEMTGFNSSAYFAYAFSKAMGCSPAAFRKSMNSKV